MVFDLISDFKGKSREKIMAELLPELNEVVENARLREKSHYQIILDLKKKLEDVWLEDEKMDSQTRFRLKIKEYLYNLGGNV
jgi:hypothetical protein